MKCCCCCLPGFCLLASGCWWLFQREDPRRWLPFLTLRWEACGCGELEREGLHPDAVSYCHCHLLSKWWVQPVSKAWKWMSCVYIWMTSWYCIVNGRCSWNTWMLNHRSFSAVYLINNQLQLFTYWQSQYFEFSFRPPSMTWQMNIYFDRYYILITCSSKSWLVWLDCVDGDRKPDWFY